MKTRKILYSAFVSAMAAFTLASCEDVPEPYVIPGAENGAAVVETEPAGDGTLDVPFNVAGVIEYIQNSESLDDKVYIKGVISRITQVDASNFGNATFYISDDGTQNNEFYIYRCLSLGGNKFQTEDEIKVGDEVIIYGNVTIYNGTYETSANQAYIYSLNGKTSGGDNTSGEATGDGTLENPYNSVAANKVASSLASGEESDYVYIKGKVVSIKENYTTQYGNATFYISDDGTSTNQFYVFRILYLDNKKYTSGSLLQEGDDVVVYAKLTNYNGNTPETVQNSGYLYSLNSNGESTEKNNLIENGDFETWENGLPVNWKSTSTASNATLTQSTEAHSGSYSVSVGFYETANKRLGYKEITLKPGTYTFSFYAKSTTSDKSQTQAGYVPVTEGKVGSYNYLGYVNINNTSWTLVSGTFTLEATTTICLVIMNPKTTDYATAQNILIDDASLTTSDGGIE